MTKPVPIVVTRWERFMRLTVWHEKNTDPRDPYRHGPRFWYPGFDLITLGLGLYAFFLGSPLLNRLFPVWFVDMLGVGLIAAAVAALVGVVFPKLYLLELGGKLAIVFMLGGYAGTVAALSKINEPNGFVVGVLFAVIWLLGPRITPLFIRLANTIARRRARAAKGVA